MRRSQRVRLHFAPTRLVKSLGEGRRDRKVIMVNDPKRVPFGEYQMFRSDLFPFSLRRGKFRAGSNRTAYAPVGIARADDAGHSFPDRAYCRTHRVPGQCCIGFSLLVLDRNGIFNFAEFSIRIFQE